MTCSSCFCILNDTDEFKGPVILNPVTLESVGNLNKDGAVDRLKYVAEAVNLTRHKLEGVVPLFAFSGGPVRLLCFVLPFYF